MAIHKCYCTVYYLLLLQSQRTIIRVKRSNDWRVMRTSLCRTAGTDIDLGSTCAGIGNSERALPYFMHLVPDIASGARVRNIVQPRAPACG